MMNYAPFQLDDFSGGITDYPFTAPLNKAKEMDNLNIDPNKKPIMRPGSELAQATTPQLPIGELRINSILPHDIEDIYYVSGSKRVYYPNGSGGFTELTGVSAVSAFNAGAASDFSSFSEWNKHWFGVNSAFAKPIKIFKDAAGTPQVRTAGLPKFATNPTVTPASGSNSYIWYFIYKYTYKVGDTTFIDLSAPVFVRMTGAHDPGVGNEAVITSIPVLANSGGTSYDLTKITKQIFRTTNGGKAAYSVGEIANATTSFSDNTNDASVVNNEALYITGPNGTDGALANDEPPFVKFIHIMDGTAYYGYEKVGSDIFPFRLRQSIPGDPDSVPRDFFTDIRDDMQGISSYKGRVIVGGTTKMYRIDGQFDELGRGGMQSEEISKVTGCISHESMVQTEIGVFFAGNNGFYFTDGYSVQKISDSINVRYKNMVTIMDDLRAIQGRYDALNMRVYWTVKWADDSADNDTIVCLDLRNFAPGMSAASFTTWTNEDVFNPCAIAIYKDELLRGDFYGYVYRHDEDLATDPWTNHLADPDEWGTKAIVWNWVSAHLNFGMPSVRKHVSQVMVTARNLSNLSIQPYSVNDDSTVQSPLTEIRIRNAIVWGDPEVIWGNTLLRWMFQGLIEQRRRFPAGGLRCSYKQLRLTNAYTIITNSDTYSTVTIDRVTKVATLDDVDFSWPADLKGYDLVIKPIGALEQDYELSLPIASRDSDTEITLSDPTDLINTQYPASQGFSFENVQWVMKGIPKNEVANIMSVIFYFAPLTPTQSTFQGTNTETGKNTQ